MKGRALVGVMLLLHCIAPIVLLRPLLHDSSLHTREGYSLMDRDHLFTMHTSRGLIHSISKDLS